jgi:hypothetical protein
MSDWATEARLKLIHQAIEEETWFPSGIDMTGAYDEVQAEKARLAEAAAAKEAEEKARAFCFARFESCGSVSGGGRRCQVVHRPGHRPPLALPLDVDHGMPGEVCNPRPDLLHVRVVLGCFLRVRHDGIMRPRVTPGPGHVLSAL